MSNYDDVTMIGKLWQQPDSVLYGLLQICSWYSSLQLTWWGTTLYPTVSTQQCLHPRSVNESWIVHGVDMLFFLHSSPHNFVQGHHSLQRQPIQKLQNTLPHRDGA